MGKNRKEVSRKKKEEVQEEPIGPLCQVLLEGQIS